MVCKDWKKGKKIFVIACALLVLEMIVLGGAFLILSSNEKSELDNNENLNTVSESKESDFSGDAYNPISVYDETKKEVSLDDFGKGPLAMVFFDNSEESLDALRIFADYEESYSGKVTIIGIYVPKTSDEDFSSIKQELVEKDIYLNNILFDKDYSANNQYSVITLPSLLFINKNGEIINTVTSAINQDVVNANLDILAENY